MKKISRNLNSSKSVNLGLQSSSKKAVFCLFGILSLIFVTACSDTSNSKRQPIPTYRLVVEATSSCRIAINRSFNTQAELCENIVYELESNNCAQTSLVNAFRQKNCSATMRGLNPDTNYVPQVNAQGLIVTSLEFELGVGLSGNTGHPELSTEEIILVEQTRLQQRQAIFDKYGAALLAADRAYYRIDSTGCFSEIIATGQIFNLCYIENLMNGREGGPEKDDEYTPSVTPSVRAEVSPGSETVPARPPGDNPSTYSPSTYRPTTVTPPASPTRPSTSAPIPPDTDSQTRPVPRTESNPTATGPTENGAPATTTAPANSQNSQQAGFNIIYFTAEGIGGLEIRGAQGFPIRTLTGRIDSESPIYNKTHATPAIFLKARISNIASVLGNDFTCTTMHLQLASPANIATIIFAIETSSSEPEVLGCTDLFNNLPNFQSFDITFDEQIRTTDNSTVPSVFKFVKQN